MKKSLKIMLLALVTISMSAMTGCKKDSNDGKNGEQSFVYFCNDLNKLHPNHNHTNLFDCDIFNPTLEIFVNDKSVKTINVKGTFDDLTPIDFKREDKVKGILHLNQVEGTDVSKYERYDIFCSGGKAIGKDRSSVTIDQNTISHAGLISTQVVGLMEGRQVF